MMFVLFLTLVFGAMIGLYAAQKRRDERKPQPQPLYIYSDRRQRRR